MSRAMTIAWSTIASRSSKGFARLDLATALNCPWPGVKSAVEAGRFVVPFGAFAAQSNPGVYRTVSRPLIYNMGQGVYDGALGQSVLPMPFSDEGANISFGANVFGDVYLNWNNYVIHGLQATRGGLILTSAAATSALTARRPWVPG